MRPEAQIQWIAGDNASELPCRALCQTLGLGSLSVRQVWAQSDSEDVLNADFENSLDLFSSRDLFRIEPPFTDNIEMQFSGCENKSKYTSIDPPFTNKIEIQFSGCDNKSKYTSRFHIFYLSDRIQIPVKNASECDLTDDHQNTRRRESQMKILKAANAYIRENPLRLKPNRNLVITTLHEGSKNFSVVLVKTGTTFDLY